MKATFFTKRAKANNRNANSGEVTIIISAQFSPPPPHRNILSKRLLSGLAKLSNQWMRWICEVVRKIPSSMLKRSIHLARGTDLFEMCCEIPLGGSYSYDSMSGNLSNRL